MTTFIRTVFVLVFFLIMSACDEDSSAACTGNLCPFVGNWQLVEVSVDGNVGTGDYSQYQLNLSAPVDENPIASYTRNFNSNLNESGTWTVSANTDLVILTEDGQEEVHVVEQININTLITVLQRKSMKGGPEQLRYVFTK